MNRNLADAYFAPYFYAEDPAMRRDCQQLPIPMRELEDRVNGDKPLVGINPLDSDMPKASKSSHDDVLRRLQTELARLKNKLQMGQELELEWIPNDGPKSGEVTGSTIRIYEADPTKALDTLRHEFIEYLLTRDLVAPYKRLINKLISLFEEEMYDRKEKLVERLQELTR